MSLENSPSSLVNFSETDLAAKVEHSYRFRSFELKPLERQLLQNGEPIPLTPKAFDILTILIENAGHLVRKEEIIETVWADAFVEEANLTRLVHTLRKTLGEDEVGNKFIETVAKQGYRFVADVSREAPDRLDTDVWPDIVATREPDEVRPSPAPAGTFKPIVLIGLGATVTLALIAVLSLTWRGESNVETASIAVLPFRPNNTTKRNDATDLAFADALINQLNQSKQLRVRSFNTIRKYVNTDLEPAVIGDQQKVEYVLVSNYFVEGDRVKGTSELYHTATGTTEAAFPFEGTSQQILVLAESIASSIRSPLLARLSIEPGDIAQRRGTTKTEAWQSYLHGFELINKRTQADAEKAVLEFENAIRIDPEYARGYIGLAQAHQTAVVNGSDPKDHCPQNLAASRRALELAPNFGEAHTSYGASLNFCAVDRQAAEVSLRRGVELDPNSYYAHTYLGAFLAHRGGSPDESIAEINKAIDLNPDLLWLQRLLGRAYFFAKRYDEAIPRFEKAWDVDPGEVEQALLISSAYELKGDLNQAFDWFLVAEKAAGRNHEGETWRSIYANAGWRGVLQKRFERAELTSTFSTNDYFEVIHTAAALGEVGKGFDYFAKACAKPGRFSTELPVDPYLDTLRADPRWNEFVSRCWKTGDAY